MTPTEPNNPALKLVMAKLLPNVLTISDSNTIYWTPNIILRESEWLYVIHLVEQTLSVEDKYEYGKQLAMITLDGEYDEDVFAPNGLGYFDVATLTFNQRATAMCKVKNIEV